MLLASTKAHTVTWYIEHYDWVVSQCIIQCAIELPLRITMTGVQLLRFVCGLMKLSSQVNIGFTFLKHPVDGTT